MIAQTLDALCDDAATPHPKVWTDAWKPPDGLVSEKQLPGPYACMFDIAAVLAACLIVVRWLASMLVFPPRMTLPPELELPPVARPPAPPVARLVEAPPEVWMEPELVVAGPLVVVAVWVASPIDCPCPCVWVLVPPVTSFVIAPLVMLFVAELFAFDALLFVLVFPVALAVPPCPTESTSMDPVLALAEALSGE